MVSYGRFLLIAPCGMNCRICRAFLTMPDNHTFTDLIRSANKISPLDPGLIADLKSLETLQDFCPVFDDHQRREPNEVQLEKMYDVTERIAAFCGQDEANSQQQKKRNI